MVASNTSEHENGKWLPRTTTTPRNGTGSGGLAEPSHSRSNGLLVPVAGGGMRKRASAGIGAVAMAALVSISFGALAAEVERPATYSPGKIPGIRASGPNYTILSPVRSDGFLRIYNVNTPYGNFAVTSDAMMQVRIRELAAVAELDKLTESNEFNNALGQAGLAPVKFAGELIVNPVEAIGNTLTGLGNQIGQIGSGHQQCRQVAGPGVRRPRLRPEAARARRQARRRSLFRL